MQQDQLATEGRGGEGVADDGGYLVRDAFLELGDDPAIHVEVISIGQIVRGELP